LFNIPLLEAVNFESDAEDVKSDVDKIQHSLSKHECSEKAHVVSIDVADASSSLHDDALRRMEGSGFARCCDSGVSNLLHKDSRIPVTRPIFISNTFQAQQTRLMHTQKVCTLGKRKLPDSLDSPRNASMMRRPCLPTKIKIDEKAQQALVAIHENRVESTRGDVRLLVSTTNAKCYRENCERTVNATLAHGIHCHQVACLVCSEELLDDGLECPLCKVPITHVIKILPNFPE